MCECFGQRGGPGCEACKDDEYGGGCARSCELVGNCSGHGRCSGQDGACRCFEGWSGARCEAYGGVGGCLSDSECGGPERGRCGADRVCECFGQRGGPGCEACKDDEYGGGCARSCELVGNCSGHGRCSGQDGACRCFEGWFGSYCTECTSNVSCTSSVLFSLSSSSIFFMSGNKSSFSSSIPLESEDFFLASGSLSNSSSSLQLSSSLAPQRLGVTGAQFIPAGTFLDFQTSKSLSNPSMSQLWSSSPNGFPASEAGNITRSPSTLTVSSLLPSDSKGTMMLAPQVSTSAAAASFASCEVLANCSGHGLCSNRACECFDGWEGLACLNFVGVVSTSALVQSDFAASANPSAVSMPVLSTQPSQLEKSPSFGPSTTASSTAILPSAVESVPEQVSTASDAIAIFRFSSAAAIQVSALDSSLESTYLSSGEASLVSSFDVFSSSPLNRTNEVTGLATVATAGAVLTASITNTTAGPDEAPAESTQTLTDDLDVVETGGLSTLPGLEELGPVQLLLAAVTLGVPSSTAPSLFQLPPPYDAIQASFFLLLKCLLQILRHVLSTCLSCPGPCACRCVD